MKWEECSGSYKAVVSLGSTCQTAYQLKRLGLRGHAGPLDWFISQSAKDVARLIRNRFKGFMSIEQLQTLGTTREGLIVKDSLYNIDSFHDFPITSSAEQWMQSYRMFNETMVRRVNRFLNQTIKNKPILFIRSNTTMTGAQELQSALRSIMHPKFKLLIVNFHLNGWTNVQYDDWGLDGICCVRLPSVPDWKGSNYAWDTIVNGLRLQDRKMV